MINISYRYTAQGIQFRQLGGGRITKTIPGTSLRKAKKQFKKHAGMQHKRVTFYLLGCEKQ